MYLYATNAGQLKQVRCYFADALGMFCTNKGGAIVYEIHI